MPEADFSDLFKINLAIESPNLILCNVCGGTGTIKVLVAHARYNASDLTRAKYVDCPKCKGVEMNARTNS